MPKHKFNLIDTDEYEIFDTLKDDRIIFRRKNTINDRNARNQFIYKGNFFHCEDAIHYAEVISYEISKIIDVGVCEAELAGRKREYNYKIEFSGEEFRDVGCNSYFRTKDGDSIINGLTVLSSYFYRNKDKLTEEEANQQFFPPVDVLIKAVKYWMIDKAKMDDNSFQISKEKIIDMIIFDCAFLNYDRVSYNWSIIHEGDTNKVGFYSLYDNEAILGFDEREENVKDIIDNNLMPEYCEKISYKITVPGTDKKDAKSMIQYLLKNYPEETKKSLDKLFKLKLEDLDEILTNCEGLPSIRIKFAELAFEEQNKMIRREYDKFKRRKEFCLE